MKQIIYILVILTTLLSCDKKGNDATKIQIMGFDDEIAISIDSLVSNFHCFQLESTPDCILSGIMKVEVIDSLIIVSDSNHVVAFTRDGKFSHSFGERGRAENEYLSVGTFMQTPTGNIAIIDGSTKKILLFTLDGRFISSKTFTNECLCRIQNGSFIDINTLFLSLYIYNDLNSVYGYFDMDKDSFVELAKTYVKTDNIMMPIGKHSFSHFGNDIHWVMPFSPTISSLKPEDATYEFKTSKEIWGKAKLKQVNDFSISTYGKAMDEGVFMGFTDIFETDRYMLLPCSNLNCTVVDKVNKTCRNIILHHSDKECTELPLFPIRTMDGNTLVCDVFMLSFQYQLKIPETNNENLRKLKQLQENTDWNGNPVLFFYKLKSK